MRLANEGLASRLVEAAGERAVWQRGEAAGAPRGVGQNQRLLILHVVHGEAQVHSAKVNKLWLALNTVSKSK